MCVRSNSCIEFEIYDSYGDGLSHGGNGYYKVFKDDELIISSDQGAAFGFEESKSYCYTLRPRPQMKLTMSTLIGALVQMTILVLGDLGQVMAGIALVKLILYPFYVKEEFVKEGDKTWVWDDSGSGASWDDSVHRPVKKENTEGVEANTIITFRSHHPSDLSKFKVLDERRLKNW